jgi:CRP/FNR family transcriptional regulator, cyclic AMP receptor protein
VTMRPSADQLAGVELFSGMSPEELEDVAGTMQLVSAPVGDVLTSESDDMKAKFFVLLQGTVTVHRDGHHVADLGPGEVFGEAVSEAGQPRNATVIVTTPAELGVVMGWDLRALMERLPSVRTRLDEIASSRSAGS